MLCTVVVSGEDDALTALERGAPKAPLLSLGPLSTFGVPTSYIHITILIIYIPTCRHEMLLQDLYGTDRSSPGKMEKYHAGYTAPTRQYELDTRDQEGVYLP